MNPLEIFAFGAIGFWLLLVIANIVILTCVEFDFPGWAFWTLVAFGFALPKSITLDIFHEILEKPYLVLVFFLGYLAAGTVWSIVKWWIFVRRQANKYRAAEREFKELNKLDQDKPIPQDIREKMKIPSNFRGNSHGLLQLSKRPRPNENKRKILTWMMYWPWSAIWTILDEPVKKAFKEIFNQIRGLYEKISSSAFKDIDVHSDDPEI